MTPVNLPDVRRRPAWLRWTPANPLLRGGAYLLWAAAIVAVVTPFHMDAELPRVGTIAEHDYKASRDFTVQLPNPRYDQERRERLATVLPVYDYRADLGEHKAREIEAVFAKGRKILADLAAARTAIEEAHARRLRRIEDEIASLEAELEDARRALRTEDDARRVAELEAQLEELRKQRERVVEERERALAQLPEQRRRALARFEAEFRERLGLGAQFDHGAFEVLVRAKFPKRAAALAAQAVREALSEHRVIREISAIERSLRDGLIERSHGMLRKLDRNAIGLFESVEAIRRKVGEAVRKAAAAASPPLDPELANAVSRVAELSIEANFVYSPEETHRAEERALRDVRDRVERHFLRGETIVRAGEPVTQRDVDVLRAMRRSGAPGRAGLRALTAVLLVFVGTLALVGFVRLWPGEVIRRRRDYALIALVILIEALVLRGGVALGRASLASWPQLPSQAFHYGLPVAVGSMLLRVFLRSEAAVVVAVLDAVLAGILFWFAGGAAGQLRFEIVVYALLSGLAGVFAMREIRQRTSLVRAGVIVGLLNVAVACALDVSRPGATAGDIGFVAGGAFVGGLLDYLLIVALAPMLEWVLGYASDIKLLELANLNSPLLRKLAMEAPGTYHHSMMVGNLAEQAAAAIGAHALLARVGAYYHDIGKTRSPFYFAENQRGVNPHDRLQPRLSAMLIRDHVTYGIELARRHKLPSEIIAFIPEHHGTSLIAYFYAKAREQAGNSDTAVNEADFRYPGPKPQSKETAIVMLADSVEATVRSLATPNPTRIGAIVEDLVRKRIADGQLDESNLTFRDVDIIIQTFTRVLASMYHARPEYPPLPPDAMPKARPDAARPTQPAMPVPAQAATAAAEDRETARTQPDLPPVSPHQRRSTGQQKKTRGK